ncbi:MAG TPA: DinB family protein, partial [Thermomicrobiales bacterium]|nr:DinB family protein [Thermomicrobiales bacterium]
PKLHLIASRNNPNLDKYPEWEMTPEQEQLDREASAIEVLAEFRRLRQSTCSLLRSLPDNAWSRVGTSRREHDWQIRTLAEYLARHDVMVLRQMDETLDRVGAREGVSPAARAHLDELLRLVPVQLKQ